MFVEQEQDHHSHSDPRKFPHEKDQEQSDEEADHGDVEAAGSPERAANAQMSWNRVQSRCAVELVVLAGVKNVETTHPERNRSSKQQNAWIKRASYRDPGCRGSNPEGEPQHQR